MDNFELAECSAFYAIYAERIKRAGNEKRDNNLMVASYRAFDAAIKLSNLKIGQRKNGNGFGRTAKRDEQ